MKRHLVQILVVVANIRMRALKVEVAEGSMRTAVEHGLGDPIRVKYRYSYHIFAYGM